MVDPARPQVELRAAGPEGVGFLATVVIEANRARYLARPEPFDLAEHRAELIADATEQVAGLVADSTTSVIEADGRPVGRLRLVRSDARLEIAGLQVLPADQNRGIGTTLVERLLAEGRRAGIPVTLEVEPDNPDARRLYRRLGFVATGTTGDDGSARMVHPPWLDRQEFLAGLPRRRLAAGALIRDREGKVCVVKPTYKISWILPGGTIEAGEAPADGCRRELLEELGLDRPIGRLLAITTIAPDPPDDPHGALMLDYDGAVVDAAAVDRFVLPAAELENFRFVPPARLGDYVTERTARRVRAALEALETAQVVES